MKLNFKAQFAAISNAEKAMRSERNKNFRYTNDINDAAWAGVAKRSARTGANMTRSNARQLDAINRLYGKQIKGVASVRDDMGKNLNLYGGVYSDAARAAYTPAAVRAQTGVNQLAVGARIGRTGLAASKGLRLQGHPALIVDLEAVLDDDHVLAVFRNDGHWGAIARSNYSGLRYREPLYRTVRDLALSYFESYFNLRREKTLRRYSRPVALSRFDARGWMTAEDDLWDIPQYLVDVRHYPVLTQAQVARLGTVDRRMFQAGLVGRATR